MLWFVSRRIAGFAVTLFAAALAIFFLLDILPGDPARFILGVNASADTVNNLREQMGLNLPAWQRFWIWASGLVQGDFGISHTQGTSVAGLIGERLLVSVPLAFLAMFISVLIGLPAGIFAARHRGKSADTIVMVLAQMGIAIPNFWFGMLLVLVFSVGLHWLPTGGFVPWEEDLFASLRALVLPGLALALPQAAILARVMRTALLDVTGADYIRTARAKGLTRGQAIWRHGVRNAMLPVLTILGLQFAFLIAGTIIVENVFYLPGLGRLIFTAISARDLVLVRGALMVLVVAVTFTMLLVDIAYGLVDPRLRSRTKP